MQGAYVYLLVFQLLVVTGLLGTLLFLVFKRMREAPIPETATAPPMEPTVPATTTAAVESGPNPALQEATDKIKYLEGKLLEYQILQEELTTLQNIKGENETLKQELSSLKSGASAPTPTPEPAPVAEAMPTPPETPPQGPTAEIIPFPGPTAAESTVAAAPPPPAETNNLDSLLQQIDEIAGQGPK